jgi:cell division septum initiation protein DivIVA
MSKEIEELRTRVETLEQQLGESADIQRDMSAVTAILTASVKALKKAHPNKDLLRKEWNVQIAQLWSLQMQSFAGQDVEAPTELLRAFQKGLEEQMR